MSDRSEAEEHIARLRRELLRAAFWGPVVAAFFTGAFAVGIAWLVNVAIEENNAIRAERAAANEIRRERCVQLRQAGLDGIIDVAEHLESIVPAIEEAEKLPQIDEVIDRVERQGRSVARLQEQRAGMVERFNVASRTWRGVSRFGNLRFLTVHDPEDELFDSWIEMVELVDGYISCVREMTKRPTENATCAGERPHRQISILLDRMVRQENAAIERRCFEQGRVEESLPPPAPLPPMNPFRGN